MDAKTQTRFDANWTPEPNTGCFLWFGIQRNACGYGGFRFRNKMHLSHRLAWEWANGQSASGMVVRHTCDTPECVNPDHLAVGSIADNMRDRAVRNRTARGEHVGTSKLTERAVREIRTLLAAGASHRVVAGRYGVDKRVVFDIKHRRLWRHVS